jgi:NTP pyrophosphatase (non-canonical NTP hydrolase)
MTKIDKAKEFFLENFYVKFEKNIEKISYLAIAVNEEAGEVAGEVKKCIRDDNGIFGEDRTEKITTEMGDLLYYLIVLADHFNMTIEEIIEKQYIKVANLKKNRQ